MSIRRLLAIAQGGGSFVATPFPTAWNITKFVGNPVIDVDDNPAETVEQYVPAPLRLANGDIWVYVKGNSRIYAWKSTDDGETFTLENGGTAVLAPVAATWEGSFVLEPHVVYDEAAGTIHLYYKGRDANPVNWQWGHATADDSDPTDFTRDPANPILTKANAEADLGGTTNDLAISCVLKVGAAFVFYGYCLLGTRWKLIQATGTDWNDPAGVTEIFSATADNRVVETPSVVKIPGGIEYAMFYTEGSTTLASGRTIRVAQGDGLTWDFSDTTDEISPTTGWEDDATYSGQFLRSNVSPFSAPYIDGAGRWLYYYSGYDNPDANTGLAYMEPT